MSRIIAKCLILHINLSGVDTMAHHTKIIQTQSKIKKKQWQFIENEHSLFEYNSKSRLVEKFHVKWISCKK